MIGVKPRYHDISGMVFGAWTAISYVSTSKDGGAVWLCNCECGRAKPVMAKTLRSGRSTSCGCKRVLGSQWTPEQHRESKKKWRDAQPGYRAKESKRWRDADPARYKQRHREQNYRSYYGIELKDAEQLLFSQGGVCAICKNGVEFGGSGGARLDHCHQTKRIRGVLCNRCNIALGNFRDNAEIVKAAAVYLLANEVVS